MIAYYPMLKQLHIILALISVLLFIYRWVLSFGDRHRLQRRWLKVAPHVNDTLLLLTGIVMMETLQMSLGQRPWLMVKLIALVLYIGLGVMAIKRQSQGQKLAAGLAALAVYGYMIGASFTKSPWAWLT